MLRAALCAVTALGLCAVGLRADDTKKSDDTKQTTSADKHKNEATITKVDSKNETVTVKMKNKDGKKKERTFHLTGEVRYFDSTGRVAALDTFRSGDLVLVVEEEGRLKEIHKKDQHGNTNPKNGSKSSSGSNPGGR